MGTVQTFISAMKSGTQGTYIIMRPLNITCAVEFVSEERFP
jgi:hypothetical protein